MFGLYIHIPYCRSKCRYCDFYSTPCPDGVPEAYIDALCREMDRFSPCGSTPLRPDTLYFGGGTPSLLTPAQAARHTAAQSRRALGMAVQAGFTDISGDLMLALPAYTMAELDETIALLAESGCTHISGYLLKIEPNTVFGKCPPEALPGDDAAADFYLAAVEKLAALGYAQYEISNFARPGFESRHNRIYWDCGDYLGLGPAAHSCMGGKRFATPAGTAAFLAAPAVYEPQGECTAEDYIMLQLRLSRGLSLSALRARYGVSFSSEKLRFLQTLAEHGLAVFDGSVLRLTPRGMLVQNSILCELV